MPDLTTIPAHSARTLLLGAQGLLASPRRATEGVLDEMIMQLGFVQIDSINVVERAHHLTLGSRIDGYKPRLLTALLEHKRTLFEHWTHDASAIPLEFYPHWKLRFANHAVASKRKTWWKTRLGPNPQKTIKHVRQRIEQEGPMQSRDFEHNGTSGPWWGWKPQKVALEHMWRTGELAIARRVNFQKVYDLTERVFPEAYKLPQPHSKQHIEWACRSALARLVIATPKEIADFWNAIYAAEAAAWCKAASKAGEVMPVQVESHGEGRPVMSYALADWRERLDDSPVPSKRVRLLCPFDPVVRDRKRLLRLFGFDYRFEAFVPQAKRVYGYYVMPLIEGDRMIGRVDPNFHRDKGELVIRRVYMEPGVKRSASRKQRIEQAVARLAKQIGAETWSIEAMR